MKIKNILTFMALLLTIGIASAKPKKQAASQTPVVEQNAKPATIVEAFGKLAQNLVAQANGKPTFAFMALNSDDGNALVENYITDALTEAMFATGKIKVVERASLEKIMNEQQFQSSALINENTAAEIGNLSGANFVCYGTLKDLKSHISVNVRVVEVSTAELYAMNRDTVEKDTYLANVGFEARKETSPIAGLAKSNNFGSAEKKESATKAANPNPAPAPKPKVNSAWTVQKKRNENYTTYTFILKSSSEIFAFMGYDKYNSTGNSTVRAGVHWVNKLDDIRGTYAIKDVKGNTSNKDYSWTWWDYNVGYGHEWAKYGQGYTYGSRWYKDNTDVEAVYNEDGRNMFAFTYDKSESARFFVDLFGGEYFSVRHNNESVRFQTEGFWQTVEEQGLTREEIYKVISNDEF